MKNIKTAYNIGSVNLVFFIIYNTYFGWSLDSLSRAETLCDDIFKTVIYISIWIYFLPLLEVYKKFIAEYLKKK